MRFARTMRFTRQNLPHWEVEGGSYFVTVRCADSLPPEAVLRLAEIHRSLSATAANSEGFADLQRQSFATMEKYLHASHGECPLRNPSAAAIVAGELAALVDVGVNVPHYTVMPNHWHAMIVPGDKEAPALRELMKRVKGRSAKRIRSALGGDGAVWQREWFDRWMRSASEYAKCVEYIHANPVKAGLARDWREHRWTK